MARRNPWGTRPSRKLPRPAFAEGATVEARWVTRTADGQSVPVGSHGVVEMISRSPGAEQARYYVRWREGRLVGSAGYYYEDQLLPSTRRDLPEGIGAHGYEPSRQLSDREKTRRAAERRRRYHATTQAQGEQGPGYDQRRPRRRTRKKAKRGRR